MGIKSITNIRRSQVINEPPLEKEFKLSEALNKPLFHQNTYKKQVDKMRTANLNKKENGKSQRDGLPPFFTSTEYYKSKHLIDNKRQFAILADKNLATPN